MARPLAGQELFEQQRRHPAAQGSADAPQGNVEPVNAVVEAVEQLGLFLKLPRQAAEG